MADAEILDRISDAIIQLDIKNIEAYTNRALEQDCTPVEVVTALGKGMEITGKQFKCGEIFLPEVMVACDVYKEGFKIVFPLIQAQTSESFIGCIAIGSIYGDVHTVGKDVAAAVFAAAGFKVVDLGVTVKDEAWLQAVNEHAPDIIGLGTYMTSTFMHTRELVQMFKDAGVRQDIKVICGGPSVNNETARELGADGASGNAWEAVEIMREWMEQKRGVQN
ncbi:MAG: cobalamin-dependent protein [Verrucomicrobia bacterium]|nr:cobalamin-dependent protein [Verrucomicrobiota bacterium]